MSSFWENIVSLRVNRFVESFEVHLGHLSIYDILNDIGSSSWSISQILVTVLRGEELLLLLQSYEWYLNILRSWLHKCLLLGSNYIGSLGCLHFLGHDVQVVFI
jgi:hypothetical protein